MTAEIQRAGALEAITMGIDVKTAPYILKMADMSEMCIRDSYISEEELIIHTLEGDMKANKGDYIITGINGEKYPCKPDIFIKT